MYKNCKSNVSIFDTIFKSIEINTTLYFIISILMLYFYQNKNIPKILIGFGLFLLEIYD